MTKQMTSREFNRDTSRAKKAAESGPVIITDRGRPAHVLLSFAAYEDLIAPRRVLDLLATPDGVDEIDFEPPRSRELAEPASFG